MKVFLAESTVNVRHQIIWEEEERLLIYIYLNLQILFVRRLLKKRKKENIFLQYISLCIISSSEMHVLKYSNDWCFIFSTRNLRFIDLPHLKSDVAFYHSSRSQTRMLLATTNDQNQHSINGAKKRQNSLAFLFPNYTYERVHAAYRGKRSMVTLPACFLVEIPRLEALSLSARGATLQRTIITNYRPDNR